MAKNFSLERATSTDARGPGPGCIMPEMSKIQPANGILVPFARRKTALHFSLLLLTWTCMGLPARASDVLVLPHSGAVQSLRFGPEGEVLSTLACCDPACVRKGFNSWDLEQSRLLGEAHPWTGEPLPQSPSNTPKVSRSEFEEALFAAVSPDQRLIAVGGEGPRIRLLNAETRELVGLLQPDEDALEAFRQTIGDELARMGSGLHWHSRLHPWVRSAAFSPDGKVLVAAVTMAIGMGLTGSQIWFWDLESQSPICEPILCRYSTGRVAFVDAAALAVHPTEPLLAVALNTPGEGTQSELGEVQLMELPACLSPVR